MSLPMLLSTWSFGRAANAAAWPILARGGSSLDAVEAAARHAERDPENHTVGFGGFPDASGRVSLDACVMLSPAKRGAVCCVRTHEMAISIARRVMEQTPHVLLAGSGAEEFARGQGFVESELVSEAMRLRHAEWIASRRSAPALANLEDRTMGLREPPIVRTNRPAPLAPGTRDAATGEPAHDTIGVLAIDRGGVLCGGCSTSGLPWKLPGRVGDSPIVGHGLYVDPGHGAAVCTGRGELVMSVCGAFLAVEAMRRGAGCDDAAMEVIRRVAESFELRGDDDQVGVITLRPDGAWGSAAILPGFRVAVRCAERDELLEAPSLK
jgi:isoaspartyl peptidase/L-asparaginase-like protein (Ntn-hydrolase superfamily)